MRFKKILSFALALTLSLGAFQTFERNVPNSYAEEETAEDIFTFMNCVQFNKKTGTLRIFGEVDKEAVQHFNNEYADINPLYKKKGVKSIIASPGAVLPEDSSYLFAHFTEVTSINLNAADTSKITDMNHMFYDNTNLETLDISNFDTSNVKSMALMFYNCPKIKALDLSFFDTSNVTDMRGMFANDKSLTDIDFSSFNTSKVTDMEDMFFGCENITFLDLAKFDTSNVKNMSFMFADCKNLMYVPLTIIAGNTGNVIGGFNTHKVTKMSYMFRNCEKLESIDLAAFDTRNVSTMEGMFKGCKSIKEIDLSTFNVHNVINMSYMFADCTELEQINMKDFIPSYRLRDTSYMFSSCSSLKTIYVDENWPDYDVKSVRHSENMFLDCRSIKGGNGTRYNTAYIDCQYANIDTKKNPGYLTSYDSSLAKFDESRFLGDVNNDGGVDASDASEILSLYTSNSLNKATPSSSDLARCDVNNDGNINAVDASYVLSYYAYKQTGGTDSFVDYMANN